MQPIATHLVGEVVVLLAHWHHVEPDIAQVAEVLLAGLAAVPFRPVVHLVPDLRGVPLLW